MKNSVLIFSISFSTFIYILTSCTNSNSNYDYWTEERIKNFQKECSEIDSFNNLVILFRGFGNSEFDSVLVKEYNDKLFVDSFRIFVWPAEDSYDRTEKERSATIFRTMNINNRYEFLVSGQKPYELKNMKMILWSQETENSNGYGCEMGDFTLDGVEFKGIGNPTIQKRDSIN